MATVLTHHDQHTPRCACGWQMPRYRDSRAAHQAADLHARYCPTEPMLPLFCATCQDHVPHCPQLRARAPLGMFPLPLLGGCVEPLTPTDAHLFAQQWL